MSRRESHDASAFYARFSKPELSNDDRLSPHLARDQIWVGDARDMDACGQIADASVALVVTSPPYFAGKEYEEALGAGGVPASYAEYLEMLDDVFAECKRKLEPGGRIAVNVANLGRKPYRSLSSDVIQILEHLGFLLRGEIIWKKSAAAGGSCAWGTYQRPANPVLRDITERVVVASKGRFDRAVAAPARAAAGWPSEGSMFMDDFVDATTDVWELPADSATRVGHPAPFPVELPRRLIELYTYRGDLILDPFMGAGSTAIAAVRTGRHYVGFDTDPAYVARAEERLAGERPLSAVVVPPKGRVAHDESSREAFLQRGRKASDLAVQALAACGFGGVETDVVVADLGVEFSFRARDARGNPWLFELCGGFSPTRPGLRRPDILFRAIGKASVVYEAARRGRRPELGPVVLLTTELPPPRSALARALDVASAGFNADAPVRAVINLLDDADLSRLRDFGS